MSHGLDCQGLRRIPPNGFPVGPLPTGHRAGSRPADRPEDRFTKGPPKRRLPVSHGSLGCAA
ncbi:hypothetical protein T261_4697 [Streptomyces lydicus]|nr:hypothetical protein T261_4697 [Streptomyces lydicus]